MKIIISVESKNPLKPYQHLQPIVNFLSENGNDLSTNKSDFYLTQGGWVCDFRNAIDYTAVAENFMFPKTIHFGETVNAILCDMSWSEIRGGVE